MNSGDDHDIILVSGKREGKVLFGTVDIRIVFIGSGRPPCVHGEVQAVFINLWVIGRRANGDDDEKDL